MSTEEIDQSLHGLGGIEDSLSKNGVFSRTQKLQSEGTRDSGGFRAWLDVLESLQRVTRSSEIHSSSRAQESSKENRIHRKQSTKRTRLN